METLPATRTQSTSLSLVDPQNLANALRLAEVLAEGKLVPAHFQGSPGDCLRAVDLAIRTKQSPFAIMDKTYLVHGRLGYEGQLCAALLNASPELATRLNYAYSYTNGERKRENMACTVSAKMKGESEPRTVVVYWKNGRKMSKGAADKWDSQPDQQLAYYGARVWGRRHAPHVLLGMYTPDELEAIDENAVRDVDVEIVTPPTPEIESVEYEQDDSRVPATGGNGSQPEPEPPAEDKPPENGGPKATVKQRNKIMAQFGTLDVPDDIRHAYLAHVYGTENLGELSKANASDLIDVLTRCEEADDGDYFAKALAEAEGTEPEVEF